MEKLKQAAMEAVSLNETKINKLKAKREIAFEKLEKVTSELRFVEENQKGLVSDLNRLITNESQKSKMHPSCNSGIMDTGIGSCRHY